MEDYKKRIETIRKKLIENKYERERQLSSAEYKLDALTKSEEQVVISTHKKSNDIKLNHLKNEMRPKTIDNNMFQSHQKPKQPKWPKSVRRKVAPLENTKLVN